MTSDNMSEGWSEKAVEEAASRILRSACENNHGRYLLTQAEYRDKGGVDFVACMKLVSRGDVRWLPQITRWHPAIEATDRALTAAQAQRDKEQQDAK